MDDDNIPADDVNLGKELLKSFAVSTASSAGVYVGLGLVLFVAGGVMTAWENRKSRNRTDPA
jgi:hypothetical protein